jgi:hypothetical protein
MSMLSQKSDDGPHIAVKTQCNNTPNGSPQYTQVPLHKWAVFFYHQAAICVSFLCPIPSLRSVCNITRCIHMALQGIYSSQHHCDVVWNDTTDLLIWCIYISVLLLIPSRNFSFIRKAILPMHYAVCQPLQLSPCKGVQPQGVTQHPLEQPSNLELLSLPQGRAP